MLHFNEILKKTSNNYIVHIGSGDKKDGEGKEWGRIHHAWFQICRKDQDTLIEQSLTLIKQPFLKLHK